MSTFFPITKIYDELQEFQKLLYFVRKKLLPVVRRIYTDAFLLLATFFAIYKEIVILYADLGIFRHI